MFVWKTLLNRGAPFFSRVHHKVRVSAHMGRIAGLWTHDSTQNWHRSAKRGRRKEIICAWMGGARAVRRGYARTARAALTEHWLAPDLNITCTSAGLAQHADTPSAQVQTLRVACVPAAGGALTRGAGLRLPHRDLPHGHRGEGEHLYIAASARVRY